MNVLSDRRRRCTNDEIDISSIFSTGLYECLSNGESRKYTYQKNIPHRYRTPIQDYIYASMFVLEIYQGSITQYFEHCFQFELLYLLKLILSFKKRFKCFA